MVPLESATSLFLSGNFAALLVVLPRVPLIPQKLGIHPFGGSVAMPLGFLDAVFVGLVGLIVRCVILRLCHLEGKVKVQFGRLGFFGR